MLERFFHHESCGQCTPCREGTGWLAPACSTASSTGGAKPSDVDLLLNISGNMMGTTICALSDAAAMPARAFVTKYRAEFEQHAALGRCPLRAPDGAPRRAPCPRLRSTAAKIEVPDGTTVIQAAERLGIEIPHYCWHPGLTIAGNCRMCLVDIEKIPKLQIACNTRVTEGMVVSHDEREDARRAEGGPRVPAREPPHRLPGLRPGGRVQAPGVLHGLRPAAEPHSRCRTRCGRRRRSRSGPLVMLDQERCILCSRCVRFCDEVTHTSELGFYSRGNHTELDVAPGKTLDNPYSGNVVDICPVGRAHQPRLPLPRPRLVPRAHASRSAARAPTAATSHVYHREDRIYRFQPRENQAVNQFWMCDAGRLSLSRPPGRGPARRSLLAHRRRLRDGAAARRAVRAAAGKLQDLAAAHGAGAIGILVSAQAPNEELFLLRRLATRLSARLAGISWSPPDAVPRRLPHQGRQEPQHAGSRAPGRRDRRRRRRAPARGRRGPAPGARPAPLRPDGVEGRGGARRRSSASRTSSCSTPIAARRSQFASVVLPIGTYAESDGTFTNHAGRVQRFCARRRAARRGACRAGRCWASSSARSRRRAARRERGGGVRRAGRRVRRRSGRSRWEGPATTGSPAASAPLTCRRRRSHNPRLASQAILR